MKRLVITGVILFGIASPGLSQTSPRSAVPAQVGAGTGAVFDHGRWNRLVATHVDAAGVDYASIVDSRATLDSYVAALGAVDSGAFNAWPRSDRLAYLINAYNALVVLQVVDNYPIRRGLTLRGLFRPRDSVWQVRGFFDSIRHRVAGRDLTLDDIEHVWLRAVLREPRIHFALVCAAKSCPPLRREAYVADRIDAQLDDQAARFFNDPAFNRFEPEAERVELSSILSWFGEDFAGFAPATGYIGTSAERGSLAFASRFLPAQVAAWLREGTYEIAYNKYDWSLNDRVR